MLSSKLREAIRDYRYLLDRSYPQRAAIKLVGDRYRLTGTERSMLYRGISSREESGLRRSKLIHDISRGPVHVDTHNIMFTLANYLQGKKVYLSDDGLLRDAGEIHGRPGNKKILEKSLELLKDFMLEFHEHQFNFLLDQPVSNSGKLSAALNSFMAEHAIHGTARTENSPDHHLIAEQAGTLCSSDSVVVEKTPLPVFDLSFHILNKNYNPRFDDLSEVFA